ncbi:MAG: hypothetical protein ACXWP5_04040 [Bdellovibrionota bacterium]
MRILFLFIAMTMGVSAHADVSRRDQASTRLHAFDQFVEWMTRTSELYRISEVTTKLIKLDSGQDAVEVRINFDDSKGCRGRRHQTTCTPLDENTMFCGDTLSDCRPSGARSLQKFVSTLDMN